jgi:hypothetical protein
MQGILLEHFLLCLLSFSDGCQPAVQLSQELIHAGGLQLDICSIPSNDRFVQRSWALMHQLLSLFSISSLLH